MLNLKEKVVISLAEYAKVVHTASYEQANKLISQGWNLLEVVKATDGYSGSSVTHVLGFSFKTRAEKLLAIIKSYEEIYTKESLFRAVAEKKGQNFDLYETNSFFEDNNEFTEFMVSYELIVNNRKVSYAKKSSNEEFKPGIVETDQENLPF